MGVTWTNLPVPEGRVRKAVATWVSASDQTASGATAEPINGTILRVVIKPDSGDTQPTNLYDATLTDEHGIDVLAGQGANLANNATTDVIPGVPHLDGTTTSTAPCVVADVLTLNITNAGAAKGGTVVVYYR